MNLKALSNHSTQLDGAVTFYMMPYRTLAVDSTINELERIDPQFEFVHELTGAVSAGEPEGYAQDVETAKAIGIPLDEASHWKRRRLWFGIHDAFWRCEAQCTDIEFTGGKRPVEIDALEQYWRERPARLADRWALFKSVISPNVVNAWTLAWIATRDHTMDAPMEMQTSGGTDEEKKDEPTPRVVLSPA